MDDNSTIGECHGDGINVTGIAVKNMVCFSVVLVAGIPVNSEKFTVFIFLYKHLRLLLCRAILFVSI